MLLTTEKPKPAVKAGAVGNKSCLSAAFNGGRKTIPQQYFVLVSTEHKGNDWALCMDLPGPSPELPSFCLRLFWCCQGEKTAGIARMIPGKQLDTQMRRFHRTLWGFLLWYNESSLSTSHSVPRFKELRSVILMLSAYCVPWLKHSASAEFSYAT